MKKIILTTLFALIMVSVTGQDKYALLVIDIQNFYFPGGRSELAEPGKAALKAAEAIRAARAGHNPVIFIQHKSSSAMEINEIVKPADGEKIVVKTEVNSFLGTDLKAYLEGLEVDTLIICGMQTHMCVEAAVRAAHDFGYTVILLHDACATRNLKFGDREVAAADVHAATLATLKSYATVISVGEWLDSSRQ